MSLQQLRAIIDTVEIGPPIQDLFSPSIRLVSGMHAKTLEYIVVLEQAIKSPDAEGKRGLLNVKQEVLLHREDLKKYSERPDLFISLIFSNFEILLEHELKESFKVNGHHWLAPHKRQQDSLIQQAGWKTLS